MMPKESIYLNNRRSAQILRFQGLGSVMSEELLCNVMIGQLVDHLTMARTIITHSSYRFDIRFSTHIA